VLLLWLKDDEQDDFEKGRKDEDEVLRLAGNATGMFVVAGNEQRVAKY
jgi:hypothetical protein